MKKLIFTIFILIAILFLFPSQEVLAKDSVCLIYFTGVGCPHCAKTDSVILEDLPKEYPNLIIIEYEIYQQRENALILDQYCETYDLPHGIPLILFGKSRQDIIVGDTLILKNVREKIETKNKCCLMNGSEIDFADLNLANLPGQPKIWRKDRVLIKTGEENKWIFGWKEEAPKKQSSGEINPNDALLKLIREEDTLNTLKGIDYSSIESMAVPLSGKYIIFNSAIEFNVESESIPIEEKLTLPKILSLAVVDAINPCALAVLTLMLVAILTYNPTKKRNILLSGLAFVTSVFVIYLIYGSIIIKSFQLIQSLTAVRVWLYNILGFGAIILGCFKIKDFFQAKEVCKINPRVDKIISKITSPKGAFLVGAFVTIFLLPCTIGPYIICGGILSPLGLLKALPWLLLYNLIFVLPMIVAVLIIYLGLSKIEDISSWQARNVKYLNLITGLIILGLGIAMVLGLV